MQNSYSFMTHISNRYLKRAFILPLTPIKKITRGLKVVPRWSAIRSATCKAAEDDCLERRNSIRPCVPSHVAYKAERGGNELFWSPWKNVSTLAREAPKP